MLTNKFKSVSVNELIAMDIPKQQYVIYPILPVSGLMMIYAKAGVGKTFLALNIACKIALGEDIFPDKWTIRKKHRVLYIDGEMPSSSMKDRIMSTINGLEGNISILDHELHIINSQLNNGITPNLSDIKWQDSLIPIIDKFDVIIIDNISTLCGGGKENESQSWDSMSSWLLKVRALGKSVILIHHAGKNGEQRGNSKKTDILDTVIQIKSETADDTEEFTRINVIYEKTRNFKGKDAEPFQLHLKTEDNKIEWNICNIDNLLEQKVLDLYKTGEFKQRDIAQELGTNLTKINRIINANK